MEIPFAPRTSRCRSNKLPPPHHPLLFALDWRSQPAEMNVAGLIHRHRGPLPIKSAALLALCAECFSKPPYFRHGVNTPVADSRIRKSRGIPSFLAFFRARSGAVRNWPEGHITLQPTSKSRSCICRQLSTPWGTFHSSDL